VYACPAAEQNPFKRAVVALSRCREGHLEVAGSCPPACYL